MTDISNALSVSSFICSLAAVLSAARIATRVRELRDRLQRSPLSRIQSLETSHEELAAELQAVANRVKMMRVRNATNHTRDPEPSSEMPDPHTQPEAWRKAMNLKIAQRSIGLPSN